MKNSLLVSNNNTDNNKKVERYILNYLSELKIHFSLSDCQLINILNSTLYKLKKSCRKKTWYDFLFKVFKK